MSATISIQGDTVALDLGVRANNSRNTRSPPAASVFKHFRSVLSTSVSLKHSREHAGGLCKGGCKPGKNKKSSHDRTHDDSIDLRLLLAQVADYGAIAVHWGDGKPPHGGAGARAAAAAATADCCWWSFHPQRRGLHRAPVKWQEGVEDKGSGKADTGDGAAVPVSVTSSCHPHGVPQVD